MPNYKLNAKIVASAPMYQTYVARELMKLLSKDIIEKKLATFTAEVNEDGTISYLVELKVET